MSGYQRFIAYVYEYQKGKKAGNCGFLKVEIKNSSCRIEIHLHCPGLPPEVEAQIYGFFRKDGLMNGILLGSCQTSADMAECVIECDGENISNTGVPFKNIGGIVIQTQAGGFYGTEWDDQPVRPDNFREVKPIESEKSFAQPQKENDMPKTAQEPEPLVHSAPSHEEEPAESPAPNAAPSPNTFVQPEERITPDSPSQPEELIIPDSPPRTEEHITPNSSPLTEELLTPDSSQPEELLTPDSPSRQTETYRTPEPPVSQPQEEIPAKEKAPTGVEAASAVSVRQPYPFSGKEFTPFDDTDFLCCWKIHPNDLMRFSPGTRTLRNNRFLQYGFYHFGHLLLGVRPGGKYILGVPGSYDQQERFMANMFGFPYFRESRIIQLPRSRGGYWYRSVDAPNFH